MPHIATNLAAATLQTIIDDCTAYESMRWRTFGKEAKRRIIKDAEDAIFCTFTRNPSLILWLELTDIPLPMFRDTIRREFPKTYKMGVKEGV